MSVPFIDLKRWEPDFLNKWEDKIRKITANAEFIAGSEVKDLEKKISNYCKTNYTISCANGTDALSLALRAAGVGVGDNVIIPDLTFWATFEAVVNVGAKAICVDISPEDLQMDFLLFKKATEKYKPKAAILVHLYGWGSLQLNEYRKYCEENDIFLIEDGAQSYGTLFENKGIFENAKCATLSFYPAKVLGGAGDGGAVVCNDSKLAEDLRRLANHGRLNHYEHSMVGWNSRLDNIQAAYLNLSHEYLDKRLESRESTSNIYKKSFNNLSKIKYFEAPSKYKNNNYLNLMFMSNDFRSQLEEKLKENQISYAITYPIPITSQIGSKNFIIENISNNLEKTEALKVTKEILNLPLFPYMTEFEINKVCDIINLA